MKADRQSQASTKKQRTPDHRSNGDASTAKKTDVPEQRETTEFAALQLLLKQFHELREYFSYYVSAKTDGVKLSVRNTCHWIVLAALGFVAISGLIITASWLLLSGTAEGVGVLCGGRLWVGKIVAGFLVLAGLGLGMYYAVVKRKFTSEERAVLKYEKRQAGEHAQFGRNVSEQAAAATSENQ